MLQDPLYITFGIIAGVIVLGLILKFATAPLYPYVPRRLLSAAELKFFRTLERLIPPNLRLSLKPRLGDIIDVDYVVREKDFKWKGRYGALIWSKHLDFVIYDPLDSEVVLCIELDDSSHFSKDAIERDKFKDKALEAAGIPLLRIKCTAFYDSKSIAKQLAPYLDY